MIKLLSFLLLVTAVQSDDLDKLLEEIFGPRSTTEKSAQNESETTHIENAPCKFSDGREGRCVPYYRCSSTRNSDLEVNLCSDYIDVCCPEDKTIPKPEKRETQQQGCGWSSPIGGDLPTQGVAQFGEFPWRVVLFTVESMHKDYPESQKISLFAGTGTLIHPSIVLVPAHLVPTNKTWRIRAGEWDTQSAKEIYTFQERDVASVEIHQDYDEHQKLYDIALVFLAKPFDLAPNVQVACLPPRNFVQKDGSRCFGTGWGKELYNGFRRYTTLPKKVELPVIGHDKCKERLGSMSELDSSIMCAGENGTESCSNHGISGLSCPLELQTNRYVEVGITAKGDGCDEESTPVVFVNVSAVRDWIDSKVSAKGYDSKTYTY
ncbi:hypothetical protein B5X24_HaOG208310 [Helicoverpa armigera]|nr:hypothetical protein B5X24_HaOG208310 [Helicoverpa armigera]